MNRINPFLRWAGGKIWFIKEIEKFLPKEFNNYFEPFLGGASVFFFLKQNGLIKHQAFLSDTNDDLINCYKQTRDKVENVITYLETYKNEKQFYYYLRDYKPENKTERAAKFIFLNRTSFNGIYRVNLNGKYNVPYGYKEYKILFDYDNLRNISELLEGVEIKRRDFGNIKNTIQKNDLIFLDPPYTVAHINNSFIKYNQKLFKWSDQKRLARLTRKISDTSAYYILTNAAHESINTLFYFNDNKEELRRFSLIGGKKAKREKKSEYIFYNTK